jgi:hypothetical protein
MNRAVRFVANCVNLGTKQDHKPIGNDEELISHKKQNYFPADDDTDLGCKSEAKADPT